MEASKSGPGGIRTGATASEHVLGIPTSHGPTPQRAGRTPHRVGVSRSPAESPRQPGKAFGDVRAGTGVWRRLGTVSWIVTHTKTKESELPGDRGCGVGRPTPRGWGSSSHPQPVTRKKSALPLPRWETRSTEGLGSSRGQFVGPPHRVPMGRLHRSRLPPAEVCPRRAIQSLQEPQTPAGSHLRSHHGWGGGGRALP